MLIRSIAILQFFFCCSCVWAQASKPIAEADIRKYLAKSGECQEDQINLWKIEYFDFIGDGNPQAIVVAFTCMAGTGGADIHSVFARDPSGKLIDLKIAEAPPNTYDSLFGNRNFTFSVEDRLLVATFNDDGYNAPHSSSSTNGTARNLLLPKSKKPAPSKPALTAAKPKRNPSKPSATSINSLRSIWSSMISTNPCSPNSPAPSATPSKTSSVSGSLIATKRA